MSKICSTKKKIEQVRDSLKYKFKPVSDAICGVSAVNEDFKDAKLPRTNCYFSGFLHYPKYLSINLKINLKKITHFRIIFCH